MDTGRDVKRMFGFGVVVSSGRCVSDNVETEGAAAGLEIGDSSIQLPFDPHVTIRELSIFRPVNTDRIRCLSDE